MNRSPEQPVKMLWACDECGCTDVQESAQIYMNTGECTGSVGVLDEPWCPQCEDHIPATQNATEPKPYDPELEAI